MPLDKSSLEADLFSLIFENLDSLVDDFDTDQERNDEIGRRYAQAYGSYIKGGVSCAGAVDAGSDLIPEAESAMGSVVGTGLATRNNTLSATSLVTGMTTFWADPAIIKPIPTAGPAVIVPAGIVAAIAKIRANWTGQKSSEKAAEEMAAAMDTYTKAINVTHALPGPSSCSANLM